MRKLLSGALLTAIFGLATACGNPAIDPNATYASFGTALDSSGQPMSNTEVRLLKYWSDSRLLEPTTEQIFAQSPTGDASIGFNIEVVDTTTTDADGKFRFEVLGAQIALPGGYTTADGLQEGAKVLVVVRDPTDKRAGVYSYNKVFMRSDAEWGAGTFEMWDSAASADFSTTLTTGLLKLSWHSIERGSSTVKNRYRVSVEGKTPGSTGRLIIRCNEGTVVEGGCSPDPADATKLARYISAFSVRAFYADNSGEIAAYVEANGPNHRFVSAFVVTEPVPDIRAMRDPVGVEGLWAVGVGQDQELLNTRADDGDPKTREPITNSADAIYAKLVLAPVTDAGLLNSLVANASDACLVLEFSVNVFATITDAKASSAAQWTQKGKFCGENGARNEMSALVSFDTTGNEAVAAGWMRIRAVKDGMSQPSIDAVGEVAIYTPKP